MFGVKVLPTTKIAAGTALIIDTTQAVVAWTRMGLRTDVNYYGNLAVEAPPPTLGRWSRPKPLGPNSIHKIGVTVGAILAAAVSDGFIATNPSAEPGRTQGGEAGDDGVDRATAGDVSAVAA